MNQGLAATILALLLYVMGQLGLGSPGAPAPGLGAAPSGPAATVDNVRLGTVAVDRATVRSGPGSDQPPVAVLNQGELLTVLDRSGDWYQVQLADGRSGWLWSPLLGFDTPVQTPKASVPLEKEVLGFYVADTRVPSYPSLVQYGHLMTAVAPWSWRLEANGKLAGGPDEKALAQTLEVVGARGIESFLLVHNFNGKEFDKERIHRLLQDKDARSLAARNIAALAQQWGVHGVNLDLELVPPEDASLLESFVEEVARQLHAKGLTLSLSVPAKTGPQRTSQFSGAYDYRELAKRADFLVIMAYDQHWQGGLPGPVASLQWVQQVLEYAVQQVPSDRLYLGLPAYGYDWPTFGGAQALTYAQAMELAKEKKAVVRWDNEAKAPFFTYSGHQVWFENRYSLAYKLDLAKAYDLAGVALWRLGQEDPGFWGVLAQKLGAPAASNP